MTPQAVVTVPDQQAFWDRWHDRHSVASHTRHSQAALDQFVSALPRDRGSVLEIGCGQGREARSLAERGFRVSAFDHSEVAISIARSTSSEVVDLRQHDATSPLPYGSRAFDGVFAHLSLHYFSDADTRQLINEIGRVLTPAGALFFTVRSTGDPLYGRGDRLADDMYCLEGHVRHFFSEAYARDILSGWYVGHVERYDTRGTTLNPGVFLRVLARRRAPVPV